MRSSQSNGGVTLRLAHTSEAAAIARLSRYEIEYGLRWRWTPRRVRDAISDVDTTVLVASVDGELAGFAIMRFGDDEAHLFLLAVERFFRRSGIATRLLDWLEASCQTAGIALLRLEVRRDNRGARRFYESRGFHLIGHRPRYYDGRESALVYERRLYDTRFAASK